MLERLSEMPEVFVSIITGELILLSKNPNYAWVSKQGKLSRNFVLFRENLICQRKQKQ